MLKIFFIMHQKLIKKSQPKIKERISEKLEQKSDQSILKWV